MIVTSDAEIDEECSVAGFLLYANEWDVEAIVGTSSQYHWHGHDRCGDDWLEPYLDAYAKGYPNLVKHAPVYPWPQYLREPCSLRAVGYTRSAVRKLKDFRLLASKSARIWLSSGRRGRCLKRFIIAGRLDGHC